MNQGMTAQRLRLILFIVILLALIAILGGFWFAQQNLRGYATTISKLNADAQSGDKNIETLRQLETTLKEKQPVIAKAHSLVADSVSYREKTIGDISRIANSSGVSVSSIEFTDSAAATTAPTAAPATAPTTPVTPAPAAAGPTAGVTKKTINVAIQTPLNYTNLMNFIRGIETNQLKMQIPNVKLTKDKDDTVGTQAFVIEVYVRQ